LNLKTSISFSLVNQELIATSNVKFYFIGAKGIMASKLGIDSEGINVTLVQAVKELNQKLDEKQSKIDALEARLLALESKNTSNK